MMNHLFDLWPFWLTIPLLLGSFLWRGGSPFTFCQLSRLEWSVLLVVAFICVGAMLLFWYEPWLGVARTETAGLYAPVVATILSGLVVACSAIIRYQRAKARLPANDLRIHHVTFADRSVCVSFSDGRSVMVPLNFFSDSMRHRPPSASNGNLSDAAWGFVGTCLTRIYPWRTSFWHSVAPKHLSMRTHCTNDRRASRTLPRTEAGVDALFLIDASSRQPPSLSFDRLATSRP